MTVNKIRIWDRLVETLGPTVAGGAGGDLASAAPDRIETVRARLNQRGLLPEGGTLVSLFA